MSVPATKALPPAPLSTRTRTESSASTSSQVSYRRWYMSQVIALRASGRLNVSVTIAPSRSTMTCSLAAAVFHGRKV